MKRSLIQTLIIISSIALLGMFVVQFLWIKKAWHISEKQFEESMQSVLQKSVKQLAKRELLHVISRDSDSTELTMDYHFVVDNEEEEGESSSTAIAIQIGPNRSQRTIIRKGRPTTHVTSSNRNFSRHFRARNRADSLQRRIMKQWTDKDGNVEIRTLVEEIAMEFSRDENPLIRSISRERLDSTLRQQLSNEGLDIDFRFAVFDQDADSMIPSYSHAQFQRGNKSEFFKTALFPSDMFNNNFQLILQIPERDRLVLSSMSGLLLLTLFFTLTIALVCGASIHYLIRQKKISEIKSDFINNMSHEMKTPISTISLAIDAIKHPKVKSDPDKVDHFASVIREENQRMAARVEQVLQTALLDRNELILKKEKIDIKDLLQDVSQSLELKLKKRSGHLHFQCAENLPAVEGDKDHLFCVFLNILENAMKYTREAPIIRLEANLIPKSGGIRIAIKDNGIGMSKKVQEQIFSRFYREQKGNLHAVKGFGLGLSYVQKIVEMHSGKISVSSSPGEGSTFTIILPAHE